MKQQKLKQIQHNNKRENQNRLPHQYAAGDQVLIRLAPQRKHGTERFSGPHVITKVNNNGTVELSIAADNRGELLETWNMRQIDPCMA